MSATIRRRKKTLLSAVLSWMVMILFLIGSCPASFGEETTPPEEGSVRSPMEFMTRGYLQDISFEPAYIWLGGRKGDSQERVGWLFGKTLFLTSSGDELTPREFLERYKGRIVEVGVKKNEISASVVMHIES